MVRPSSADRAPGPQVLHRAIAVLTTVGDAEPGLSLTSIAARTGLPLSTAYRLVQALVYDGLLERVGEDERYRVGSGLVALAAPALHRIDMAALTPHLYALAGDIEITASFGLAETDAMVTVCSARPVRRFCTNQLPSARQPLAHSAMGMAAQAFTRGPDWPALEQVRRRGFADTTGSQGHHVRAIAVPVFDGHGRAWGAVGVQALRRRLTDDLIREILPVIQRHAQRIGTSRDITSS
jgi:DNA-binding IclR family transcriptional regulator